jgi:hypothetical protein
MRCFIWRQVGCLDQDALDRNADQVDGGEEAQATGAYNSLLLVDGLVLLRLLGGVGGHGGLSLLV